MRVILFCLATIATLGLAPVWAESGAYDLLFKNGTLDEIPKDRRLVYAREVTNTIKPETAERDTGRIELFFTDSEPLQASLKFIQGEKYRNLGVFPASVGNPMIMYFVETVVRDMAETAGGSPFYIRNRIKESLVAPAKPETGNAVFEGRTIATRSITLRPFMDDPNRDKMKGFGDLALVVTMSENVPGWYLSLLAHVPDATAETPAYLSILSFESIGETR